MLKHSISFVAGLLFVSGLSLADEVIKASELPKPPKAPASKQAQKKAHQRVEKRKQVLEEKLKQGASPQEIGKAKAQLQVDRTEANRQDYLNSTNATPTPTPPSQTTPK